MTNNQKRFSLTILLVGFAIILSIFSYRVNCRSYIGAFINSRKAHDIPESAVIYFIQDVSLCCRQCYQYEKHREHKHVIIYLIGFTNNDRDNFVEAFNINHIHKVEIIDRIIGNRFLSCMARSGDNLLVILDTSRDIKEVRRF